MFDWIKKSQPGRGGINGDKDRAALLLLRKSGLTQLCSKPCTSSDVLNTTPISDDVLECNQEKEIWFPGRKITKRLFSRWGKRWRRKGVKSEEDLIDLTVFNCENEEGPLAVVPKKSRFTLRKKISLRKKLREEDAEMAEDLSDDHEETASLLPLSSLISRVTSSRSKATRNRRNSMSSEENVVSDDSGTSESKEDRSSLIYTFPEEQISDNSSEDEVRKYPKLKPDPYQPLHRSWNSTMNVSTDKDLLDEILPEFCSLEDLPCYFPPSKSEGSTSSETKLLESYDSDTSLHPTIVKFPNFFEGQPYVLTMYV